MSETTGQPPEEALQAPAPGAAPAPVFPDLTPQPAQEAPVPPAAPKDPSARAAELEAELAAIRADAAAGAKALVRVGEPHAEFTFAGITVGTDPTPVPERALGALLTAAAEAGVNLITEEA